MALNFRSFGFQVLVGMVVGLLLGLVARQMGVGPDGDLNWLATALKTTGSIFVSLLKAVVPPLVFAAIVASIANLRALDNAARLAGQTLLWFAITSLIAVSIGLAIGLLLEPGAGLRGTALGQGAVSTATDTTTWPKPSPGAGSKPIARSTDRPASWSKNTTWSTPPWAAAVNMMSSTGSAGPTASCWI